MQIRPSIQHLNTREFSLSTEKNAIMKLLSNFMIKVFYIDSESATDVLQNFEKKNGLQFRRFLNQLNSSKFVSLIYFIYCILFQSSFVYIFPSISNKWLLSVISDLKLKN